MSISYEKDFHGWCMDQAKILFSLGSAKTLENAPQDKFIDFINLAEEIESMGRRERQELKNRLTILFCHLLKAIYQPDFICSSWKLTINEQRICIETLLEDSPSLNYCLEEISKEAYRRGLREAEKQMGKTIPSEAGCINKIFTLKQAMDSSWLPQATLS